MKNNRAESLHKDPLEISSQMHFRRFGYGSLGCIVGATAGAFIGSLIAPGPGSVAGIHIGAKLGAGLGSLVGYAFARHTERNIKNRGSEQFRVFPASFKKAFIQGVQAPFEGFPVRQRSGVSA